MGALLRGVDVQETHSIRHAPVELWSLQRDAVAWAIHALNGSSFPVGISSLFSMGNSGNGRLDIIRKISLA
jgi:hypothetical protein